MRPPGKEHNRRSILMVGNFFASVQGARFLSEDLAAHLTADGWRVEVTSTKVGRVARLLDMAFTTLSRRHHYRIAHVDVFSGLSFLWVVIVCALLKVLRKPFVLSLRGGNLPAFARWWPRVVRHVLGSARAVTTPSTYLQEQMKAYHSPCQIIRNPIDLERYHFRLRTQVEPRIVWLRTFHAIYNPVLAVNVLSIVLRTHPRATLTMVGRDKGDGSLAVTRETARGLGILECVHFAGGVPKAEVPAWLERGDIFLNTSSIDNTPVSVIEAMACGLCVVSTNVGGIPYMLRDGVDALLVKPDNPDVMAYGVLRLLANDGLPGQLSQHARSMAESCGWTTILPRWTSILAAAGEGTGA